MGPFKSSWSFFQDSIIQLGGRGGVGWRWQQQPQEVAQQPRSHRAAEKCSCPVCGPPGHRRDCRVRVHVPGRLRPWPQPQPAPMRGPSHPWAAWVAGGEGAGPIVSLFPSTPLLTRPPNGAELPRCARLGGYAQVRGCVCVVGVWRSFRHQAHPRAGTWK